MAEVNFIYVEDKVKNTLALTLPNSEWMGYWAALMLIELGKNRIKLAQTLSLFSSFNNDHNNELQR